MEEYQVEAEKTRTLIGREFIAVKRIADVISWTPKYLNDLKPMKLNHITIENFRAIKQLECPLDPQLTVLHGNNAAGKTTILDAIAVGLGA
ncbi:hypothetical protein THIOM_004490, partial [Candidatus Thiomargarita nelsonii]